MISENSIHAADGIQPGYREFAPPPALAGHVLCLWIQRTGPEPVAQGVLPDGCVDIVWIGDGHPVVAGPATRRNFKALSGNATIFGARIRPGLAATVLGMPASELRDLDVPCAEASRRLRALEPARSTRHATGQLVRLTSETEVADQPVVAGARWLALNPEGRMHILARHMDLSPRQMHRRFEAAVGYGPKLFQRIMRFQRLLDLAPAAASLAALAAEAGFADQAHMSREVRAFADGKPRYVLAAGASTLAMADFFKTGD